MERHIKARDRVVRIRGPEAIVMGLAEFYRPYYGFEAESASPPDWTLDLSLAGVRNGRPVELDPAVYLARPVAKPDTSEQYLRPAQAMTISLDRSERSVRIVGADQDEVELQARVLLRDQILQAIEKRAGDAIVHAAAVQKHGRGIVFLGDKNAGKTTGLLQMLFGRGYDFVSSDRIKLTRALGEGLHFVGVPARVNVHQIVLGKGEVLESLANSGMAPVRQGKILIDAKLLASAAGVGVTGSSCLNCLVFPKVQAGAKLAVQRLGADEVLSRLQHNLLDGGADDNHDDWLGLFRDHPVLPAPARLAALAQGVELRGVSVEGDFSAYAGWLADGGAEDLLCS